MRRVLAAACMTGALCACTPAPQPPPVAEPAASVPAKAAPVPAPLDEQLRSLSELHSAGVLTDEEFAGAKNKLLA